MYVIGSSSAKPSAELTALLSGGRHAARKLKRAQILLAADAGASDDDIATSVGVGGSTVYRTKQRFVLGNLETALSEEPRPGEGVNSRAKRIPAGRDRLFKPPQGRARWTLELLAGEIVRCRGTMAISGICAFVLWLLSATIDAMVALSAN